MASCSDESCDPQIGEPREDSVALPSTAEPSFFPSTGSGERQTNVSAPLDLIVTSPAFRLALLIDPLRPLFSDVELQVLEGFAPDVALRVGRRFETGAGHVQEFQEGVGGRLGGGLRYGGDDPGAVVAVL